MKRASARAGALGAVAAVLSLVTACETDFTGPYPCLPGYSSCTTRNLCETKTDEDPKHCGACGVQCPRAAICSSGVCGSSPPQITSDVYGVTPSGFTANQSFLFWSFAGSIATMPKTGGPGSATLISTPSAWQSGNGGVSFVVGAGGSGNVYYLASFNNNQGPPTFGVYSVSSLGTSAMPTLVGALSSQNNFSATSLRVAGGYIYLGTSIASAGPSNSFTIERVPTSGGNVSLVTTFTSANSEFAVDQKNVYVTSSNGQCSVYSAPVTGNDVTPTPLLTSGPGLGCPSFVTSDGANVYWAAPFYLNGVDGQNGHCFLQVASAPTTGGAAVLVASIPVDEAPLRLATDTDSVYVTTNDSLWKTPLTGGTATRVAGNLGVPVGGQTQMQNGNGQCSFYGGNFNQQAQIGLVVDATHIYLALPPGNGNSTSTLFRIPK